MNDQTMTLTERFDRLEQMVLNLVNDKQKANLTTAAEQCSPPKPHEMNGLARDPIFAKAPPILSQNQATKDLLDLHTALATTPEYMAPHENITRKAARYIGRLREELSVARRESNAAKTQLAELADKRFQVDVRPNVQVHVGIQVPGMPGVRDAEDVGHIATTVAQELAERIRGAFSNDLDFDDEQAAEDNDTPSS